MDTSQLQQMSAIRRDVIVRWLVPERVIFVSAEGKINPAVRDWMNARIDYLMHSCATPQVHLIGDVSRMSYMTMSSITSPSPVLRHPRRGWFFSVGASQNRLIRGLLACIAWIMTLKYRDCATLAEALTELQNLDATLPNLQAYQSDSTLEQDK